MSAQPLPPICASWESRRPPSCWGVIHTPCTTTSAALQGSATTRACSTRLSPPSGSWQANRSSPGGSTQRNENENWLRGALALNPLQNSGNGANRVQPVWVRFAAHDATWLVLFVVAFVRPPRHASSAARVWRPCWKTGSTFSGMSASRPVWLSRMKALDSPAS
jgi:hypothetical protein